MNLDELVAQQGARIDAEHKARVKLVALAHRLGFYSYPIAKWRYVGEIDSLSWFELGERELHIGADSVCWSEAGESWRVIGEKEVRRMLLEAI